MDPSNKEPQPAETAVREAETFFFDALRAGDRAALDRVLADDFLMVDVIQGQVVPREVLLDLVGSQELEFVEINLDSDVSLRYRSDIAIVIGRSQLTMRFQSGPEFTTSSRYTHVYTADDGRWRLLAAQGTRLDDQIVPA